MSQQCFPILNLTLVPNGAAAEKRFIKSDGAQCGDGEAALGVSTTVEPSGIGLTVLGTAVIETGGIFPNGSELQSDADGKAVLKAAGLKNARALQESTAAGQFVEVLVLAN